MLNAWTWLLVCLSVAGVFAVCNIITVSIVQLAVIFCDMAKVEVFLLKLCLLNSIASVCLGVIFSTILESLAIDAAYVPIDQIIPQEQRGMDVSQTEKAYKWWKRVANVGWFYILIINMISMVRLYFIAGECSIWFFLLVAYHEGTLGYGLFNIWWYWSRIDDSIEFAITRKRPTGFV